MHRVRNWPKGRIRLGQGQLVNDRRFSISQQTEVQAKSLCLKLASTLGQHHVHKVAESHLHFSERALPFLLA